MVENAIDVICRLPQAASLQQICDLAYHILGNPVFVSDLAHTILSYTKCVQIDDPTWQASIIQSRLDRNTLKQDREVGTVHASSLGVHRPVLVEDEFMPYPRIIKTLVNKGQPVGVMVVTAYCAPFSPGDIDVTELIASFVIPRVSQEHYHVSDDQRSLENYFIKLLDGLPADKQRVNKRLDVLGWHPAAHSYLLTVCACGGRTDGVSASLEQLMERLRAAGCRQVFLYNASLVCIYGSAGEISRWDTQASALTELLRDEGLIAGASRLIRGFEQLAEYYRQARTALELGSLLGRQDSVFRYDGLSSFSMFGSIPRDELSLYCHEKIQELDDWDTAHRTELCITLQVYLEQAKSLSKTAELLFIHRNTVRYRIKKCMELLNSGLEDGNEIFAYILSLRILEYRRKLSKESTQEDRNANYTL